MPVGHGRHLEGVGGRGFVQVLDGPLLVFRVELRQGRAQELRVELPRRFAATGRRAQVEEELAQVVLVGLVSQLVSGP